MSIILQKSKQGGNYAEGWHNVTVSKADKGSYGESKYVDLRFETYPDNLKCRVWEARNQEGVEFSVSNMIRYSNPTIIEEGEVNGDTVAKVDDSPESLIGKNFQVLFYKNAKGYTEVAQKVAPSEPFKNIVDDFTADRIDGIKASAEKYMAKRMAPKQEAPTAKVDNAEVPF